MDPDEAKSRTAPAWDDGTEEKVSYVNPSSSARADTEAVEPMFTPVAEEKPLEAELPSELAHEPRDIPRRIHILGAGGSIGKLVAHSLKNLPNPPPVTLILHNLKLYNSWQDSSKQITISTEGIEVAREGFEVELSPSGFQRHGKRITKEQFNDFQNQYAGPNFRKELFPDVPGAMQHDFGPDDTVSATSGAEDAASEGIYVPPDAVKDDTIDSLIVCVKATATVPALNRLKHRLKPSSAILFLQNGMGQIDEVNEKVFPDANTRPHYLAGIISHGVYSPDMWKAVHAGFGSIAIGVPIPKRPAGAREDETIPSPSTSPTSQYLLRTICRSPVLAGVPNSPTELLQAQLEKLATNAIINPITSLIDGRNGAVLFNYALTRATRLLLGEVSLVVRNLPELKHLPNVNTRFDMARLETLAVSLAWKTQNNLSSMLQDVRNGRETEIDYINGYIVKRGEEIGITCYMNYLVSQLVKGKQQMVSYEIQDELPLAGQAEKNSPKPRR